MEDQVHGYDLALSSNLVLYQPTISVNSHDFLILQLLAKAALDARIFDNAVIGHLGLWCWRANNENGQYIQEYREYGPFDITKSVASQRNRT